MELREFKGVFVTQGGETDTQVLRIIMSYGGGVESGSGSFSLPPALVGLTDELVVFRCETGDEINLVVREVDPMEGAAYFLTEGPVPQGVQVKVA